MNFSINKESISRLLFLTSSIVEKRNTMPILANVLLEAKGEKLRVSATDLEISLNAEEEATVTTPGSITIGAKVLYEIVKEVSAENVSFETTSNQRLVVKAGGATFKINGTSSEEFPEIRGTTLSCPVTLPAEKLVEMLDKTAFSMSTDETKFTLNGIYAETVEGAGEKLLRFVSTDGHRLSIVDRPADGVELPKGVIIPRKGVSELRRVLEDVGGTAEVGLEKEFFTVRAENVVLGIRLVDGEFPDYTRVIPKETSLTVAVRTEDFLSAVKRVSLVSSDKSKTIKFSLSSDSCLVSSSSPEYGEASESVQANLDGEGLEIGFSGRYLREMTPALSGSEELKIRFSGELGAASFSGNNDDSFECVIMPMRF